MYSMKTTRILTLALALGLYACSEPAEEFGLVDGPEEIIGTWYNEENLGYNFIRRIKVSYSSDGTYESYSKAYDRSTKVFLGYLSKVDGEYTVANSVLSEFNRTAFATPGGSTPQVDLAGLVVTDVGPDKPVTIKLSNNKATLKVQWPPCGINELCLTGGIGYTLYHRSNP
jgi:hypothetical protein